MLRFLFLMAVPVVLLCHGEATAQLTLDQFYPDREVSATPQADGYTLFARPTGTVLRVVLETPQTLTGEQFLTIPLSPTANGMVAGAEPVGKFSIAGAVMGTLVAGSIGYLIVHANDRTSTFWEMGPLVVIPAGVVGFFVGGAVGGIITKPRPGRG